MYVFEDVVRDGRLGSSKNWSFYWNNHKGPKLTEANLWKTLESNKSLLTTRGVLHEEQRLLKLLVRESCGAFSYLSTIPHFAACWQPWEDGPHFLKLLVPGNREQCRLCSPKFVYFDLSGSSWGTITETCFCFTPMQTGWHLLKTLKVNYP